MSKELLFHTAEMSEAVQKEYIEATGSNPMFEGEPSTYYVRWLELRVTELQQAQKPEESEAGGTCRCKTPTPGSSLWTCGNCGLFFAK